MKNLFLGITITILLVVGNASAQTKQSDDEKAIIAVVVNAGKTWESGDMTKFAENFTENAVYINPFGKQFNGRENIKDSLQWVRDVVFKKRKLELKVTETTTTFFNSDMSIIVMLSTSNEDGKPVGNAGRLTFVLVKVKNDWKIALFQITDLTEPPQIK